jgi:hypothetical protein
LQHIDTSDRLAPASHRQGRRARITVRSIEKDHDDR